MFFKYPAPSNFALEVEEWNLPDEGMVILQGPSGCGKSTLIRCLLGIAPCPSLSWHFGEEDLVQKPLAERELGVVFQEESLFPHLTALDNLRFAGQVRAKARARKFRRNIPEERERLLRKREDLVQALDMKGFLNRPVAQLSGGERKRVALARALMTFPRFLLLDEPFSSLDPALKKETCKLVKKVVWREKCPTLLITHEQEEIKWLSDGKVSITYMKEGRLFHKPPTSLGE